MQMNWLQLSVLSPHMVRFGRSACCHACFLSGTRLKWVFSHPGISTERERATGLVPLAPKTGNSSSVARHWVCSFPSAICLGITGVEFLADGPVKRSYWEVLPVHSKAHSNNLCMIMWASKSTLNPFHFNIAGLVPVFISKYLLTENAL